MANILVLGGSGFVSSSLSKYLINRGYDIDILTRGIKSIDYQGYNEHLVCDRRNKSELKSVLKNKFYSYIFDISAYSKDDVAILFEAIEDISSIKRYIFCSSAAVYPNSSSPVNEDSATISDSAWGDYAHNKIDAENYIFDMINKSGLKATIFRPSYIYGEGNTLYREAYFFNRLNENKVIPIPDDDVKVQFIHIEDVVKNFECAMYNDNDCRAYNLTSPKRYSWNELISLCSKVVGKDYKTKKISITNLDERTFFPFRSFNFNLDITNLRENGFHSPMIYLEEGLTSSYNWINSEKPSLEDKRMSLIDSV